MAVKFEFVLNDTDASNLISILHDRKVDAMKRAEEYDRLFESGTRSKANIANRDWYEGHAEYLEGLKQKILAGYSRVE
jgi:hypothetical protein